MPVELLSGELPLSQTAIGTVDNFEDAQEFMRWLGESRGRQILAVDTESAGLDPWASDAKIRLVQFGTENEAWVINAEKYPGLCQEVLENYRDTDFVFHNGLSFDYKYMSVHWPQLKIPWGRTHETLLMCRILDNEGGAKLKDVSEKLFGREATAGQRALEHDMRVGGWTWATIPMWVNSYRIYSGVDVLLTARLYRRMEEVWKWQFREVYDLERHIARICTGMEIRGMRIDPEYCESKKREIDEYVESTKAQALERYGIHIGSTQQLARWFEERDVPLPLRTDSGAPKMDRDQLENIIARFAFGEHANEEVADLARTALEVRKADKIAGTYLTNLLSLRDSNDVLHSEINTMDATRSSRMAMRKPNLQNLPRDDKTVRPSIIPHPGHVLLTSDLDQLELRLLANLSRDPQLVKAFKQADSTGPDFFTSSCRDVYRDTTIQKIDSRRNAIKSFWYASSYGAGNAKLAYTAKVSIEEMEELSRRIKSTYVGAEQFKQMLINKAKQMVYAGQRPFVITPSGRRMYVPADKPYAAVNYMIQPTAAEVFKQNLINLDNAGFGEYMVCPVHDEIVMSMPPDMVDDARPVIQECMTNTNFQIPLTADCSEPMLRWKKS